jgi:acetyltransferase
MEYSLSEYNNKSTYLTKYTQTWTCHDGRSVVLRPICPDDKLIEKDFIQGLSSESSRHRFFDTIKEATPEMLNRFCNIDYENEIAILAEYNKNKEKRNVGVGRLIINPELQTSEFAIVVSDDFHHNGLGTKLLRILIDIARDRKLNSIYGIVLRNNYKMLSLAKNMGFTIETSPYEEIKVIRQLHRS